MINFYATAPHGNTFSTFVENWEPEIADQVRILGYSELDLSAPPTPGLHVLTDFERLLPPEQLLAQRLHRRLQRPGVRVIGDPGRWLDRHALLRRLYDEGINDFRAYTVDELGPHVRFPVFLRWANDHHGSIGDPIRNQKALDRAIGSIARDRPRRWRWIRNQLLIVEKLDARFEDGYFRKFSIARIGEEYIARHIEVSKGWVTKFPEVVTPATVAEEEAFIAEPQDLDLVKRVFEIAGIEFGRIDWGYSAGRPQIWEINTNPQLAAGARCHELRVPFQRRQAARTRAALEAQVPEPVAKGSRSGVMAAPERWAWHTMNRASRRWDPKRR